MIAQGRWHATSYALSLKDSSLSVAINRDDIVACDLAGRLYSVFHDGRHQRRSLNGTVLQKWTTDDERQRRWLTDSEADQVIDYAAAQLSTTAHGARLTRLGMGHPARSIFGARRFVASDRARRAL